MTSLPATRRALPRFAARVFYSILLVAQVCRADASPPAPAEGACEGLRLEREKAHEELIAAQRLLRRMKQLSPCVTRRELGEAEDAYRLARSEYHRAQARLQSCQAAAASR